MNHIHVGGIVSPIHEIMSAAEGDRAYKLPRGTISQVCARKKDKPFHDHEYRKLTREWIVSVAALERVYGERRGEHE